MRLIVYSDPVRDEVLAHVSWQDGRVTIHDAKLGFHRFLENDLGEWVRVLVGEGAQLPCSQETRYRVTPRTDPQWLPRVAAYLRRTLNFDCRVDLEPECQTDEVQSDDQRKEP